MIWYGGEASGAIVAIGVLNRDNALFTNPIGRIAEVLTQSRPQIPQPAPEPLARQRAQGRAIGITGFGSNRSDIEPTAVQQ